MIYPSCLTLFTLFFFFFFFQAEDGIRDHCVTGVQTCALPIYHGHQQGIAALAPVQDTGHAAAAPGSDQRGHGIRFLRVSVPVASCSRGPAFASHRSGAPPSCAQRSQTVEAMPCVTLPELSSKRARRRERMA